VLGTEAESIRESGPDRQHILDGAADFNAETMSVEVVGPEVFAGRKDPCASALAKAASGDAIVMAVGRPAPTSRAKVGREQDRDRPLGFQHFVGDLVRQAAGVDPSEALGLQPASRMSGVMRGAISRVPHGKAMTRHDDEYIACARQRGPARSVVDVSESGYSP